MSVKAIDTERGEAWGIYRDQMAAIGVRVIFGEKTPEYFYKLWRNEK